MRSADVVVIGLGAIGGAAAWQVAARGASVVAVDPRGVAHAYGSSHGESRVIRRAYFEHPDYIPLLDRTYDLWRKLEIGSGRKLFTRSGMLLVGPSPGLVIDGVRRAAALHALHLEGVDAAEARRRFPGFVVRDGLVALFEPDAGLLHVEECVRQQAAAATRLGAQLITDAAVVSFTAGNAHVEVRTTRGAISAGCLIVAAGAWSAGFLENAGVPLTVRRKVQLWIEADPHAYRVEDGSPVFGFHVNDAFFYGFPALEPGVVKLAEHTGGERVDDAEQLDRSLRADDATRVLDFAARHLPSLGTRVVRHAACMYTMTPDEHFVVGRHPMHSSVLVAAGMSGHGFKLAPIIGKALADLALDGRTSEPIGLFEPTRFRAGPA